jgi:hypothetical protein
MDINMAAPLHHFPQKLPHELIGYLTAPLVPLNKAITEYNASALPYA